MPNFESTLANISQLTLTSSTINAVRLLLLKSCNSMEVLCFAGGSSGFAAVSGSTISKRVPLFTSELNVIVPLNFSDWGRYFCYCKQTQKPFDRGRHLKNGLYFLE